MATLHGSPERFAAGLQQLAPGTFAWMQPNGSWGESNAGLVVGDRASLLVDTLWDVGLTRRMLAAMDVHTVTAPIRTVVNTHSDGDHWWGNELLADARRITSAAAASIMATQNPHELVSFKRLAAVLRHVPPRLPVIGRAGRLGRFATGMLGPFDHASVTATPAPEGFRGQRDLDVGGRAVHLIEVGPAHTPGDLIVWVPDVRVCFAADVVFIGTTPVMWAGPSENWVAALERIRALDPALVLPGHGPAVGPAALEPLAGYWRWLKAEAAARFDRGLSPFEAARDIALGREFASRPWAGWLDPERIVINCHTLHRELRGGEPVAGARQTLSLFEQVARLAGDLRSG